MGYFLWLVLILSENCRRVYCSCILLPAGNENYTYNGQLFSKNSWRFFSSYFLSACNEWVVIAWSVVCINIINFFFSFQGKLDAVFTFQGKLDAVNNSYCIQTEKLNQIRNRAQFKKKNLFSLLYQPVLLFFHFKKNHISCLNRLPLNYKKAIILPVTIQKIYTNAKWERERERERAYLRFYVPLKNIFTLTRSHHCRCQKGCKIYAYARCSGPLNREGSLSCHTCCDTGPRFFWSHPKDCPISVRFLRHIRGCGGPTLTRILTGV
jgi:hypothetical protein